MSVGRTGTRGTASAGSRPTDRSRRSAGARPVPRAARPRTAATPAWVAAGAWGARRPPSHPREHDRGLLAHDAPGAGDVGDVVRGELSCAGAALHLPHPLDHVRGAAAETGLSHPELATVRVAREVAPVREVVLADERHALTGTAEPRVLDGEEC